MECVPLAITKERLATIATHLQFLNPREIQTLSAMLDREYLLALHAGEKRFGYLPLLGRRTMPVETTRGLDEAGDATKQVPSTGIPRSPGNLSPEAARSSRRITVQPTAITTATELPGPAVEPHFASAQVKLYGPAAEPTVKGTTKPRLTKAQYDVVCALIQGGEDGLTKDTLDKKSEHGDSRKIMKRLSDSDPDWKSVLLFPGTPGKRYRIC